MRFEELDLKTLENIGSPEIQARAQELTESQQLQFGYRLPDRLQAVIWDGEAYPVEARIKDAQLLCFCPCSQVEEGQLCAHSLALLRAWVTQPQKFLSRSELLERLKKYSKKALVEIILDLADQVPEVRGILKEEEQELEDILESIDHTIEQLAEEVIDPERAEVKLRRAQTWADRLAQSGKLSEARSIYFYLLDNILGLEERLARAPLFSKDLKEDLVEEYCQFIHEDRQLERELVQQELEQLESYGAVSRGELDLSEVKQELLRAS